MIRLSFWAFVLSGFASQAAAGPLHDAVKKGDVEQVAQLIAAGEDINEIHRVFGAPLHLAAIWADSDIAVLLVDAGADVSAEHRAFGQPLNAAAGVGNVGVAEVLIANAANVNARTRVGTTALHSAAERGHAEVVEILVANGADPNAKGDDGYGPVHLAGRKGHFDVVVLLRHLGAAPPDIESITDLLSDADPEAGGTYFGSLKAGSGNCHGCHHIEHGPELKPGPDLQGIVGREKAAFDGFNYSPAFGRLEGVWTVEELNAFIASPTDHAPGTRMEIAGVPEASVRANLIAYLQQFDSPPANLRDPKSGLFHFRDATSRQPRG